MKIDFHSHVKLSKKTNFSLDYFKDIVKEAKGEGLTALAVTEHFNTLNFDAVYDTLDVNYEYKNDYYEADGLKIFTGMEVDVAENGHVLVIGNLKNVKKIRKQLAGHEVQKNFIGLQNLFELCSPFNMLVIGGHPFREEHPLYKASPDLLKKFDAFDMNGKDLFEYGIEEMKAKVLKLGQEYNIPIVTGSDSHQYLQLGCVASVFKKECDTIEEIKREIAAGNYEIYISDCLITKVKAATMIKKLLKKELEVK